MQLVKYILIGIFSLVSVAVIILATIQSKEDSGASSAMMGTSGNFYEKNKGNTREGKLKRNTIVLSITFVILVIILSIVYGM